MNTRWRLWTFVVLLWLISTVIDRLWWNLYAGLPSWDQADYLNSALDHGRALGILPGGEWRGFDSLLDLSPKIPPLASLVNGTVIALAGDAPEKAAWSLSLWHGLLLFAVASWGLKLSGQMVALIAVVLVAFAPALVHLRMDYLLEMPLTSVASLAILRIGCWWHPKTGARWYQAFIASFLCLVAVLVKQSALLILLPALIWAALAAFNRNKSYRYQLFAGFGLFAVGLFPWLHHNWITTIGGTNRAVFESAAREGDPSLWTVSNWLWYPVILPVQLGWLMLLVGVSGLFLWFFLRKRNLSILEGQSFSHDDFYAWRWLIVTLILGWLLTTINPNKGDRYIAPLLPLLLLLLSRGWLQWGLWIKSSGPRYLNRFLPTALFAGFLALLPAAWLSQSQRISHRHDGPLEEIVLMAGGGNPDAVPTTLIVVPSTPDLNQHNVSYFGRRMGGRLVGRQLGSSPEDIEPVLGYATWVVLAEGDQGSVRDSAVLLDKAIRESDVFDEIARFPRQTGGSYSLWKRNLKSPYAESFARKFPSLAVGLADGLQGLEPLFSEVAVHHMLDGHFLYRQEVQEMALRRLEQNRSDLQANWTLGLLAVLANRPSEASHYFAELELISPETPWPSIYRCVVILADWKPWQASHVVQQAQRLHANDLLQGLDDLSSVLGGAVWRLSSAQRSIPRAIKLVEQSLTSQK